MEKRYSIPSSARVSSGTHDEAHPCTPSARALRDPAIHAMSGVCKHYRRGGVQIWALRDIGIDFRTAGVTGVLGPNGSGKSTLIKILSGLCTPDSGHISPPGAPARWRDIGVLLEGRSNVNERLSTFENARYYCTLREHRFDRPYFEHLARQLALADPYCPIRQLSTGLKLRSSLLLAFIHRPSMLLLDEPTLGLDVSGVACLEALIASCAGEGARVLVGSHDLAFLERICQRIICLNEGKIVFDGSADAFRSIEYAYKVSARFASPDPSCIPEEWKEARFVGHQATLLLEKHEDLCRFMQRAQHNLSQLQAFEVSRLTLHDKYMQLLAGGIRPETGP